MKQLSLVFPEKKLGLLQLQSEPTHISQISPLWELNITGIARLSEAQSRDIWKITDMILPLGCPRYRMGEKIFISALAVITCCTLLRQEVVTERFCECCQKSNSGCKIQLAHQRFLP